MKFKKNIYRDTKFLKLILKEGIFVGGFLMGSLFLLGYLYLFQQSFTIISAVYIYSLFFLIGLLKGLKDYKKNNLIDHSKTSKIDLKRFIVVILVGIICSSVFNIYVALFGIIITLLIYDFLILLK